jgi:hypothetical protein
VAKNRFQCYHQTTFHGLDHDRLEFHGKTRLLSMVVLTRERNFLSIQHMNYKRFDRSHPAMTVRSGGKGMMGRIGSFSVIHRLQHPFIVSVQLVLILDVCMAISSLHTIGDVIVSTV